MISANQTLNPARVVYLGPEGSFAHLVARKRFTNDELIPQGSVDQVFDYLQQSPGTLAVVPIENSSGGVIKATVDRIIEENSPYHIREEISLDVKLALLGREGDQIRKIYSHFAPFDHCKEWLKSTYPEAEQIVTPSTPLAAINASQEMGSAAIGSRESAERYGLDILHYPIEAEVKNVTEFFVVSHTANFDSPENSRTSLAVELPDSSGSLFRFLGPLAENHINLKRIESRPIHGRPNHYRFFIEIESDGANPNMNKALEQAKAYSLSLRNFGSYPSGVRFES